jgi:hypothetical protein
LGSSAGSGLPLARSRRPSTSRGRDQAPATGGRQLTRAPLRAWVTTSPRERSSLNAAATVVGLTPSSAASVRTGGSAAPGASAPASIPRSMLAAISAAPSPLIRYCVSSEVRTVL